MLPVSCEQLSVNSPNPHEVRYDIVCLYPNSPVIKRMHKKENSWTFVATSEEKNKQRRNSVSNRKYIGLDI